MIYLVKDYVFDVLFICENYNRDVNEKLKEWEDVRAITSIFEGFTTRT